MLPGWGRPEDDDQALRCLALAVKNRILSRDCDNFLYSISFVHFLILVCHGTPYIQSPKPFERYTHGFYRLLLSDLSLTAS